MMPALAVDDTSSDESDDDEVQARQRRRRRSDGAFKQTIRPEDAQTRRAAVAQERLRAEGPWEGPPPAASGRTELDHRTSGEARGWGQGFSLLQRTGGATFAAEQRRAEQQRKVRAQCVFEHVYVPHGKTHLTPSIHIPHSPRSSALPPPTP